MKKSGKRRASAWDMWYALAERYYIEHGDLLIPRAYVSGNLKLGRWLERQRAAYNGVGNYAPLTLDRIAMLERIGMVWKLESRFSWDTWLSVAAAYRDKYGNLLVPKDYSDNGYNLGAWIGEVRKQYKAGTLSEQRIHELNSTGMVWEAGPRRFVWEDWLGLAEKYFRENGHLRVPFDYITAEGRKLGQWINCQRESYSGSRRRLSDERIAALSELGMVWSLDTDKRSHWCEMYRSVAGYYYKNGKLPKRPYLKAENGYSMGKWIGMQRSRLKQPDYGGLDAEQQTALHKIGIEPWGGKNN